MPIKVQSNLPAIKILETENIFVMPNEVAPQTGYPSAENFDSQPHAHKNRD